MKFNERKNDEGIKIVTIIIQDDEYDVKCIQKAIDMSRDNGGKISKFILDRGYCFKPIILACFKSRNCDLGKLVDLISTVTKYNVRFNSRGPWKLSSSCLSTSNSQMNDVERYGRPFCSDGAQCALRAKGEI